MADLESSLNLYHFDESMYSQIENLGLSTFHMKHFDLASNKNSGNPYLVNSILNNLQTVISDYEGALVRIKEFDSDDYLDVESSDVKYIMISDPSDSLEVFDAWSLGDLCYASHDPKKNYSIDVLQIIPCPKYVGRVVSNGKKTDDSFSLEVLPNPIVELSDDGDEFNVKYTVVKDVSDELKSRIEKLIYKTYAKRKGVFDFVYGLKPSSEREVLARNPGGGKNKYIKDDFVVYTVSYNPNIE